MNNVHCKLSCNMGGREGGRGASKRMSTNKVGGGRDSTQLDSSLRSLHCSARWHVGVG